MRILAIPARGWADELRQDIVGKSVLERQLDMATAWQFNEAVVSIRPEDTVPGGLAEIIGDRALVISELGPQDDDGIALSMADCLTPLQHLPGLTQLTFLMPHILFRPQPPHQMFATQQAQRSIHGTATTVYTRQVAGRWRVNAIQGQLIDKYACDDKASPGIVLAGTFTQTLATWRSILRDANHRPGFEFLNRFEPIGGVHEHGLVAMQVPEAAWHDVATEKGLASAREAFAERLSCSPVPEEVK